MRSDGYLVHVTNGRFCSFRSGDKGSLLDGSDAQLIKDVGTHRDVASGRVNNHWHVEGSFLVFNEYRDNEKPEVFKYFLFERDGEFHRSRN